MYIIRTYCFRSMQQREVIYIIRTFSLPELVQTIHFDEIIDEMVVENSLTVCVVGRVLCVAKEISLFSLWICVCVCITIIKKKHNNEHISLY